MRNTSEQESEKRAFVIELQSLINEGKLILKETEGKKKLILNEVYLKYQGHRDI